MKLWIIGNPISGGGKARPRIEALTALLRQRGHEVEPKLTTHAGHAGELAGGLPEGLDRLIVAGGDGTLNEVLNGLRDPSQVLIAQMPVGTANVLARELGLPWQPAGVAELVDSGVVRRVDMGVIRRGPEKGDESIYSAAAARRSGGAGEPARSTLPQPLPGREGSEGGRKEEDGDEKGEKEDESIFPRQRDAARSTLPQPLPGREGSRNHRFLCVTSCGFDAMVIEDIHTNRKGKLGLRGYIRPIWRTLRRYTPPALSVRVDGGEPVAGAMVVVANAANYAGLLRVADQATMDDGVFDVCILPRGGVAALTCYAWSAWRAKLSRRKDLAYVKGRHITIDSPQPVQVEVDGEYFGHTPVEVQLHAGLVPVVVPAGRR